ncbi:MAG: DUF2177 family protein [Candidatus Magasanikbacteria bacterium]|jgi:uncharacterized membrane protein|nr:DUF2177 family protein [Candidatus Magasanikbacteria bacterium]MBT4314502.1 DUF2177 family protein [Candidatus Magasanikbacteria bacterium]MBT4547292.1 DUF2177 family protein [Candidatus Magasanikbacteria bacterium]MBT6818939.1 DUF2177 family protein [Candidatus Magasanikbacteria bacterium]
MSFLNYIKIFLLSLVSFLLLDGLWLLVVAKNFYKKYLGFIMGPVNWVPVMIFYPLYIIGLVFLVIVPAIESGSWVRLLFGAALFGLCAYGAYDLTNQATIKDWPWIVTIVDILWGMIGAVIVSSVTFFIINKFF